MHSRSVELALRLCVVVTALTAAQVAWSRPTVVNGLLYFDLGLDEGLARGLDRAAALLLLASAAALLLRSWRWPAVVLLVWLVAVASSTTLRGEGAFSNIALPAHAARYGAPLALLLLGLGGGLPASLCLRLCAALTFAAHGYEALVHNPYFIDLLLLSAARVELQPTEASARLALDVIAWVDLAVAVLVLVTRWRPVALYMAAWGAVTAASRVTALGLDAWTETGMRAANALVPLALYLAWRARPEAASATHTPRPSFTQ